MELASSARAEHILKHRTISQALRSTFLADDGYDDADDNGADGDRDDDGDSDMMIVMMQMIVMMMLIVMMIRDYDDDDSDDDSGGGNSNDNLQPTIGVLRPCHTQFSPDTLTKDSVILP